MALEGRDVVAERDATHGPASVTLSRTAQLWSAYLGRTITAHDVAMLMVLSKCSRAKSQPAGPGTDDHYLDIAGYARLAQELA